MTGSENTYILDTGADISVFKRTNINPKQLITTSNAIKIKGATDGVITSLGTTETEIFVEDCTLQHTFHIVDSNFPIPADAILGRDFIAKYNCILDYSNWTMSMQFGYKRITIPIFTNPGSNVLFIPPRCEVIREMETLKLTQDALVLNKEIHPGVFISRTIVSKNCPLVKIINTTSENVIVKDVKLETIPLDQFHICNVRPESNSENNTRYLDLLKELSTDNIPTFAKNKVLELCNRFSDIFALKSDKLTVNNFYKQELKLRDNVPVYIKNYRTPKAQKAEINRQVAKMLDDRIIEPSISEYNSPILLVPKKSASAQNNVRLVVDFRGINKKLISDKFPLSRIDDILDQLGRARWFSVIDLASGFHQIPLEENSRNITSFSTDFGTYRFTRLPFGLSTSPNSFSRMMSLAFAGVTPEKAFLYMDDLIVIGCSENHHLQNLEKVFEACRKYNLKLNPVKCRFFNRECTFLGHKITSEGILPDDSKYEVINNYPVPKNADEVKRFVAFTNYYRRFIPRFAEISAPLNKLTRKRVDFNWTPECQQSFITLKKSLISPRILQYPDFSKPFIITCDSSRDACGAVLSQKFGDSELPIAYASRSFTKSDFHKPTILKELIAVHWAIKYFHCYVYNTQFLVKTDHRPLVHLFSMKDPTSKLTRIRLDLEEYNFEIQYIKGKDNVCADALSRISIDNLKDIYKSIFHIRAITRSMSERVVQSNKQEITPSETPSPRVYEALDNAETLKIPTVEFHIRPTSLKMTLRYKRKVSAQKAFPIINGNIALEHILPQLESLAGDCNYKKLKISLSDEIFKQCTVNQFKELGQEYMNNLTIVICNATKVITNENEKLQLIEKFHNNPLFGGHCGQKRLLKKLRSSYRWKNMSRDVANFIKKCHECQTNKIKVKRPEPLVITPTPQKPFDIVCIDTIGKLPRSTEGHEYAVTIQCELTKYIVIIPICNKLATTVADSIVKNFILVYGPMKEVRTDMGTEYKNQVFENITKILKINHKMSTAYHSQSIGGCERNHRVLNEYMRMYINDSKSDWPLWAQYYAFCYNTTPNTYHNYTPFELVYGRKANLSEIMTESRVDPLYNIDAYDQEFRYRLQLAHARAKECITKAKLNRKTELDKKAEEINLKAGDLISITNETRHKFDAWYNGPFTVVDIQGPNCTIKDSQDRQTIVHKNRIRKYNN